MLAHPRRRVTRFIISSLTPHQPAYVDHPRKRHRHCDGGYAHRSDASHSPVIERILAEAGAYYTCKLVFSMLTAMKSRSVYYT